MDGHGYIYKAKIYGERESEDGNIWLNECFTVNGYSSSGVFCEVLIKELAYEKHMEARAKEGFGISSSIYFVHNKEDFQAKSGFVAIWLGQKFGYERFFVKLGHISEYWFSVEQAGIKSFVTFNAY